MKMTAQPCLQHKDDLPAGSQAKCPPPAPSGKELVGKMVPSWGSCPPSAHLFPQPHQGSGFTAQTEQGGRQWKTNGDRGFTGKGWIQGRQSKAEGDLQGQQQFTQQVARRQGFTGAGEKCILWAFIGN